MIELTLDQVSVVENKNQVDLRTLFDSSIDDMNNGTFWFPADLQSNESKFEYFENVVSNMFSDNETFAYKRTIAGKDVVFHIGKRIGTAFVYVIGLVTSIDGSKSWIYKNEAYEQQMQFLINNNFTGVILNARKDSDAEKHVIERYTNLGAGIQHLTNLGEVRNTLIKFPIYNV